MDRALVAKQAAATYWQVPEDTLGTTDLTEPKFPWAKKHAFYMAMDARRRRLLVVVDAAGAPTVFEPVADVTRLDTARFNRANMGGLLVDEGVTLPAGLDLPWTARALLAGLGGWVASPAFWEQERDAMAMWASKRPKDGPRLFQDLCREPDLAQRPDGTWTYEYRYFNLSGGVETWTLEGDARELSRAEATMALPNGTWFVPYG